jgi:ATP diphosphatase
VAKQDASFQYDLSDLLKVMSRLRDPETGCSWDVKQNYRSIAPSTIEEAYEVVDAIEREDYHHLREELGDLLFQVVFYAQLAIEEQRFSFHDVVTELAAKLIRRHPHVFPEGTLLSERQPGKPLNEKAIAKAWEAIKEEERAAKGARGVLDDIPMGLPAMSRAAKLQKRASRCGFDWPDVRGVFAQLQEELQELQSAVSDGDQDAIADEAGDLLFAAVNLVRHLKLDGEAVLRQGNQKFERRFRYIESRLAEEGSSPEQADVEHMESLWQAAKRSGL